MLCKLLYNNIVDNRQSSASITMDILKINKTQYLHSKKLHGKQNAFLQNENVLVLITFTGCDCQSPSNTIFNHIFSFKCYLFFSRRTRKNILIFISCATNYRLFTLRKFIMNHAIAVIRLNFHQFFRCKFSVCTVQCN